MNTEFRIKNTGGILSILNCDFCNLRGIRDLAGSLLSILGLGKLCNEFAEEEAFADLHALLLQDLNILRAGTGCRLDDQSVSAGCDI